MDYVLELSNIYKYYGSLAANKDVSLKVKKGSVHAIVGENGAGKSTLMNVIAGVISPDSGTIKLNGKDQVFRNANDANRAGIGMVQQEFMLFDRLSVLDNIIMGYEGVEKGCFINRKACEAKIKEICEEYGFHFELNALVRDLPIAVQQQVEIVKVLYRKADIIILDEPTAGLDPRGREAILAQLRDYHRQKGNTVILVSHSMEEVARNVDRIVVMSHSHKLMDGTPEEVFSRAEELLQVGLDVPQVTKVAMELQKRGLLADSSVYTIDELVRRLLALKGGEAAC